MSSNPDPQGPGDDEEQQYPGDSSGHLNPALQQFVGQQQTQDGQVWAGLAANRIQDYLTARSNAIDAEQAGNQFVTNLNQTKQGLVSMVQSDPGSIPLALDLAQHSVSGLVDQHANLTDDQRAGAASQLTGHIQTEIAHAGIQGLAEQDKGAALQALDKFGHLLPDDQQAALRQYADVQEGLRGQDAVAQQTQQTKDAAVAGYHAASGYMAALADPQTGGFRAPPSFLTSLVADPSVALPTKLALRAGYHALNQYGDAPQSDPHVVADLLGRMADPATPSPQQGEIISHLGSTMTLADASFMNRLLGPSSPQRQADISSLSDTVQQARATLAHPMNGAAGDVAFGRYTNWLLPALQRGANLGEIQANNPIQNFAPTVADYRTATRQAQQARFARNA